MMDEAVFINQINRFFNYGYTGKAGKLAACLDLSLALPYNAEKISGMFANLHPPSATTDTRNIQLPVYDGNNKTVTTIGNHLRKHLREEISHVILHGSLATGEENNYSDFDGLIILKDEIFKSKSRLVHTAHHLNKTYKMMLSYDRHQHHGWFILSEKHLKDWPCSFFPPEIFNYAKSIHEFTPDFQIHYNEKRHYTKQGFIKHCHNILHKLEKSGLPGNIFQTKSLLSEFMLLPSLYIQVNTGKGIFKKNSFAAASGDFQVRDWQIMEDISAIRNEWPAFAAFEYTNGGYSPITRYRQIHDGLQLPVNITRKFNTGFVNSMIHLTTLFIEKSNAHEVH